ncbi:glycosyltransferase family 2 protein [Candidatus Woesearchaeota archaeon]|nr:glycosyltransferase family 2 protein [Candidatus Woesearchaeota archaeon]
MKKLSIIIPVYNEQATIGEIVKRVKTVRLPIQKEIILVDDGSTDGGREIIEKLSGCKKLFHENNRGKGAAIRTGLESATGDYCIIQDADLEYNPEDYRNMLQLVLTGRAKIVYGSRNLRKSNVSGKKLYKYGGIFVTIVTNLLFGTRLTDEATCYKLFPTRLLKSLVLEQHGFGFCPEVTAKVSRLGYEIVEVPISYQARREGKKLNAWHGIEAILFLLKYRFLPSSSFLGNRTRKI